MSPAPIETTIGNHLKILVCGASGTGKTTIVEDAINELNIDPACWLKASFSEAYKWFDTTPEQVEHNKTKLKLIHDAYAATLLGKIVKRNVDNQGKPSLTIMDRSCDVFAYCAMHGIDVPNISSAIHNSLFHSPGNSPTIVFLVAPNEMIIEHARASDSNRRNMFLSDRWVYGIDGALRMYFAENKIKYTLIERFDRDSRVDIIGDALKNPYKYSAR